MLRLKRRMCVVWFGTMCVYCVRLYIEIWCDVMCWYVFLDMVCTWIIYVCLFVCLFVCIYIYIAYFVYSMLVWLMPLGVIWLLYIYSVVWNGLIWLCWCSVACLLCVLVCFDVIRCGVHIYIYMLGYSIYSYSVWVYMRNVIGIICVWCGVCICVVLCDVVWYGYECCNVCVFMVWYV
jgi:hypothetical protein